MFLPRVCMLSAVLCTALFALSSQSLLKSIPTFVSDVQSLEKVSPTPTLHSLNRHSSDLTGDPGDRDRSLFVPAHFSSRISSLLAGVGVVYDDDSSFPPSRPRLLFPESFAALCFASDVVSPFEATFEMQHLNPAPLRTTAPRRSRPPSLNRRRSRCSAARNTTPLEYITSPHFPDDGDQSKF